jgi:hypothetical protein
MAAKKSAAKAAPKKAKHAAPKKAVVVKKAAKKAHKRPAASAAAKKARVRKFGPYTALDAHVGGTTRHTFAHRTKKGVRKIPVWAMAGITSRGEARKYVERSERPGFRSAADKAVQARIDKIHAARKAAAERVAAGKSIYYPNAPRVISYEDLMKANKKKKARKAAPKKARKAAKKPHARKAHKRVSHKRPVKRAHKKAHRRVSHKRKARRNPRIAGAVKKAAKRDIKELRSLLKKAHVSKSKKKSARKGLAKVSRAFPNKRHALPAYLENKHYAENRRRRRHRRHAHRNPAMMGSFVEAFKTGGVAAGGFIVHRALSYAISDMALSKIEFFSDGKDGAKFRRILSGIATLAIGIPLTDMAGKALKPEHRSAIKAGMVVSVIQQAIVTALAQSGDTGIKALPYFAGVGEYMATSGYGEYMAMQGFGDAGYRAAAAGYGAVSDPRFEIDVAAAGYGAYTQPLAGQLIDPRFSVDQAVAGMGEYMAQGVRASVSTRPPRFRTRATAPSTMVSSPTSAPLSRR